MASADRLRPNGRRAPLRSYAAPLSAENTRGRLFPRLGSATVRRTATLFLLDSYGPRVGMHRLPDAQIKIELKASRLLIGGDRLPKASLEPPLIEKPHLEAETAQELGQLARFRGIAELNFDAAKPPLELPQSRHLP